MDLLKFMYINTFSARTSITLVDVVMVADKFEVVLCMRYCICFHLNQHISTEIALHILDLPCIMKMDDEVLPLKNVAKLFLTEHFKGIIKWVYTLCWWHCSDYNDFPWYHQKSIFIGVLFLLNYSGSKESYSVCLFREFRLFCPVMIFKLIQRMLSMTLHWNGPVRITQTLRNNGSWDLRSTYLFHLIWFPYMTFRKLKEVIKCNDFDEELASKHVFKALFYKAESPYKQRSIAAQAENANRYVERAYNYKTIKALAFETPHQHCVIYLELKRDECASLFPASQIYSQACNLVGQSVFLTARCTTDPQIASHCLGLLFLYVYLSTFYNCMMCLNSNLQVLHHHYHHHRIILKVEIIKCPYKVFKWHYWPLI